MRGAAASDQEAYGAFCRGLIARGVYPPASQFEAWFPSLGALRARHRADRRGGRRGAEEIAVVSAEQSRMPTVIADIARGARLHYENAESVDPDLDLLLGDQSYASGPGEARRDRRHRGDRAAGGPDLARGAAAR